MNKGSKKPAWDNYSDLPSPDAYKNDYQDVLSTEDCALQALTDFAQEHGLYDMTIEDNPLIKK